MKDLFKLYYECKQEAMLALIPFNAKAVIEWYHGKSNWGRCWYGSLGIPTLQISYVLSKDNISDKAVKETILHEMLHTCPGCQDHGKQFKHYASILNNKYGYNIKRRTSAAEKGIDKASLGYDTEVTCTDCGTTGLYKHTSKIVKRSGAGFRCRCGCRTFKFRRIDL